jgi:hypothetical protein
MVQLSLVLVALTLAAALGAWVDGTRTALAGTASLAPRPGRLGLVLWPFGARAASGISKAHAARLNKALVVFLAALALACAFAALYANFSFLATRPPVR